MNTLLKLTCGLAIAASSQAFAVTTYVDVGHRDNDLHGTQVAGVYWTTFGWQGDSDSNVPLLDGADGSATGWTIDFTNVEGDSPNSAGPLVPALHVFTTSDAATDGLWNRPGGTDERLIITISGLDATGVETYNLSLYGNRSNNDDAGAIFEVQGAGALISSGEILQGNLTGADTPYDVAGVQADGSGEIVIELATPVGTDLSILSAMSITSIPEPSTTALLGLGGLALILRRKK